MTRRAESHREIHREKRRPADEEQQKHGSEDLYGFSLRLDRLERVGAEADVGRAASVATESGGSASTGGHEESGCDSKGGTVTADERLEAQLEGGVGGCRRRVDRVATADARHGASTTHPANPPW